MFNNFSDKVIKTVIKMRTSKHISKLGFLGFLGLTGLIGFIDEQYFIFFIFFVFFNFFWFDKMNEIEEYRDERFIQNQSKADKILLYIFIAITFILFVFFTRAEKFDIQYIPMSILKYSIICLFSLILTLRPALLYYFDKVKK